MTVEKPKPKQLLRPITTGADSAMNQSQFLAITCNSLEARERSRVHGAIDFGFASHWLKNWRESFKLITKRSNRDHVITFDSHSKHCMNTFRFNFFLTRVDSPHCTLHVFMVILSWQNFCLKQELTSRLRQRMVTWHCIWLLNMDMRLLLLCCLKMEHLLMH